MEIEPFKLTDDVLDAFNRGFSDYVVDIPLMNKSSFAEKMIENNCSNINYSCVTDKGKAIGISLCGIDKRCLMINSFCVVPEYRGSLSASLMMDETIKKAGDREIVLEVIDKNLRALNFYRKYNFVKKNDISYMIGRIPFLRVNDFHIRDINYMELINSQAMIDVPLNWQSSISCLLKQNIKAKAYCENGSIYGFVVYTDYGAINIKQLYVVKEKRNNYIAYKLLSNISRGRMISAMFIQNGVSENFYSHLHFKEKIHLYEMHIENSR